MGLLLFVPAGTLRYWQAWVYLSVFMGASALTTLYLVRKDRALLERRMSGGPTAEKRPVAEAHHAGTSIGFIALLVVPALDHRFGWSTVPLGGVVAGDVLVAIGFCSSSSCTGRTRSRRPPSRSPRTRRCHDGAVRDRPPSDVRERLAVPLRHAAGARLVLGARSAGRMMPFLIWRLLDEERLLARNLPGYTEYQQRVRYRLVPFVW